MLMQSITHEKRETPLSSLSLFDSHYLKLDFG
jgi:hypothetical protein